MPNWTGFTDWMRFQRLDKNEGLSSSFTLAYKITDDNTGEKWSSRYVKFKAKDASAIIPAAVLLGGAVPPLLTKLGLSASKTIFLPALSSSETAVSNNNIMGKLAAKVAEKIGAQYVPSALTKNVHKPLHTIFNAADRDAELEKANYKSKALSAKTVFIFDDFITQGATLSKIAQAILASNAGTTVYALALGKTETRRWIPDISNAHVPEKWNGLWLSGEQKYAEAQKAK